MPEPTLLEILRLTPRRYRMPELPKTLDAAVAAGSETVLAFAIESARAAAAQVGAAERDLQAAFAEALAALIRRAMASGQGDPVFQAQVLLSQDAQVQAWVQLAAFAAGDERTLRVAVDAFAHPGKLQAMPEGPMRRRLEALHALAVAGDWDAFAARAASPDPDGDASRHADLQRLMASPALSRRRQAKALRPADTVQSYLSLMARASPEVGSAAAREQGRASARAGELTERAAAAALGRAAEFLNERSPFAHRVVRSLRTPRELTGAGSGRAKEEWDAAIVKEAGEGAHALVLLAEAKAAPAAATTDLPRLLRGLDLLAAADALAIHVFKSADGDVRLRGDSLQALRRSGGLLPAQVIYLCTAPAETRMAFLGAAARAHLLSETASLRFAAGMRAGRSPSPTELAPVWKAVVNEQRLRQVLDQYDTARRARDAMLHPDDLRAAVDIAGSCTD